MESFLTVFHVFICGFLILVVLLQSGKGGGLGSFGGSAAGAVFGPRGGATLLSRVTGVVAFLFLLSSMILSYLSKTESVMASVSSVSALPADLSKAKPGSPTPAAPAPAPVVDEEAAIPDMPVDPEGEAVPGEPAAAPAAVPVADEAAVPAAAKAPAAPTAVPAAAVPAAVPAAAKVPVPTPAPIVKPVAPAAAPVKALDEKPKTSETPSQPQAPAQTP